MIDDNGDAVANDDNDINNNNGDAPPVAESSKLLHAVSQLTSSYSIGQPLLLSRLPFLPDFHAPEH